MKKQYWVYRLCAAAQNRLTVSSHNTHITGEDWERQGVYSTRRRAQEWAKHGTEVTQWKFWKVEEVYAAPQ